MNATFSDWFRELQAGYHHIRVRYARSPSTATYHRIRIARIVIFRKQCVHNALIEMGLNP